MFGFLKDKLKGALGKLTKKVEEAPEEEITVEKEVAKKPKKEEKPKVEKKPQKKEVEKPAKKEIAEKKESPVKKKEAQVEEREAPAIEGQKVAPAQENVPKPRAVTEEQAPKQVAEIPKVEPESIKVGQKKGFFSRIFGGKEEPKAEVKAEVPVVTVEQKIEKSKSEVKLEVKKVEPKKAETEIEAPVEEKGFFRRVAEKITTKKISSEQFDELFWDLELALLENNVALEVIEKIKADLKSAIVERPVPRGQVEETIVHALQESLSGLFIESQIDIVQKAKEKKPLVVCFVGVNGSGKTTSIAKMTKYLQSNGLSVVLAAADTFRAAAIDQLQLHADNLGVKLIRHDYGSDPAAVAFDAVKHAEAAKKDVVLIDTAGRLHSNINLVDEMKKIVRVAKPDLKIFVGESITGNDCVEQARKFDEAVGIDGIILAKADIDEKGGAAISVSFVTKKPILFLGMGQEYKDFQPFDKDKLLASLGL